MFILTLYNHKSNINVHSSTNAEHTPVCTHRNLCIEASSHMHTVFKLCKSCSLLALWAETGNMASNSICNDGERFIHLISAELRPELCRYPPDCKALMIFMSTPWLYEDDNPPLCGSTLELVFSSSLIGLYILKLAHKHTVHVCL